MPQPSSIGNDKKVPCRGHILGKFDGFLLFCTSPHCLCVHMQALGIFWNDDCVELGHSFLYVQPMSYVNGQFYDVFIFYFRGEFCTVTSSEKCLFFFKLNFFKLVIVFPIFRQTSFLLLLNFNSSYYQNLLFIFISFLSVIQAKT